MPTPHPRVSAAFMGLAVAAAGAALAAAALGRRRRAAFDDVNDRFHAAYDRARRRTEHDAPVLVVLTDSLILCRDGRREETTVTPPVFHVIKSVAHAPVAVFSALHRVGDDALYPTTRARLATLRRSLDGAMARVDAAVGDPGLRARLHAVLSPSSAFVGRALDAGRGSLAELDVFARDMGPLLLECTHDATQAQLASLNTHVAAILGQLSEEDRRALHVVVIGDHQARQRSLAMQYFAALFRDTEGADDRLTYGEGVTGIDEALALVGTQRFDREIAAAFFGDANRLQRDVLGDAVRERLRELVLPRYP